MTSYQADYATFISLRAGGGAFWYSQVEAIDSLCTVEIYLALEELFWVITNKEKHQSFNALQRGTNSHNTFTRVEKLNVYLSTFSNALTNLGETMQLNL